MLVVEGGRSYHSLQCTLSLSAHSLLPLSVCLYLPPHAGARPDQVMKLRTESCARSAQDEVLDYVFHFCIRNALLENE